MLIGHGSDGCRTAVTAHELGKVTMVNAELVSMNATEEMHHLVTKPGMTGTLALFNAVAWAQPLDCSLLIEGGKVAVCQLFYHNLEKTSQIAEIRGGILWMSSAMLPEKDPHFLINGGTVRLKANLSKQTASMIPPACREALRITRNAGAVSQACGWWI